jgi:ubiquinone/menaquinone biosynthesis C-methylase UbiE
MTLSTPTTKEIAMTDIATPPDLAAIKRRQQATWASGDYHMVGTQIVLVSELMIEALDVHSTERVLDVATGSGNAALAAARRGCEVIGTDYVPALLARARDRATAEGLEATFMLGDAEALPFEAGEFDVVSSVFGAMFAPDQERTANELTRVCRSGGRVGLVTHTPDGFIGQLFKVFAGHVPPPAGLRSPIQWGTESRLRELFGDAIAELHTEKRHMVFRYESPEAYLEYWRRYYGPTLKAFDAVGEDGRAALERDLLDLIARFNRADDGTMIVASEYLETVIVTR